MNQILIEKEIQRRVAFKMHEFKTAFKNALERSKFFDDKSQCLITFRARRIALEEIGEILDKEINLPTIYCGNFDERTWKRKEKIVDKLSDRLLKMGNRNFYHEKSFINNCIEEFILEE